jgi:hypothetical protein
MQTDNAAAQLHTDNISKNQMELQNLGSQLNGKAGFVARKEEIMTAHIEALAKRNNSWIERMAMSSVEKEMLKGYVEKQKEALDIIHDNQNKALAALCGGQVAFIKEVVNTMLKTGRAGLKAGADMIFTEYKIQRAEKMEVLTQQFYNLIERKFADAEKRSPLLQEMKLKEIDMDIKKWNEDYELLLNEFSNILTEQV